ncbi:MAG: hypothetical protein COA79_09295 [Planctomycetota bacterium]|nr:MAG: hypothetical protein COA79_09295 [Planctomycetota bacterium]
MNKRWIFLIVLLIPAVLICAPKKKPKKKKVTSYDIPKEITKDLVLEPRKKPYTTIGFVIKKGVSLTIKPGVKIEAFEIPGEEGFKKFPAFVSIGTLKIGKKKSKKKVLFLGVPPLVMLRLGSKAEIYNTNFFIKSWKDKGASGSVVDCEISSEFIFTFTVPKTGLMKYEKTVFRLGEKANSRKQNFMIEGSVEKGRKSLSFESCAFMSIYDEKTKAFKMSEYISSSILIFGKKVDLFVSIKWVKLDAPKLPVASYIYFHNQRDRKLAKEIAQGNKGLNLKIAKKPLTKFKKFTVKPK